MFMVLGKGTARDKLEFNVSFQQKIRRTLKISKNEFLPLGIALRREFSYPAQIPQDIFYSDSLRFF